MNRPFSFILIILLITGFFTIHNVKADDFAAGDGSAGDPYLITKIEHLWNVRNYLTKNFTLGANLDFDDDGSYLNSSHKTTNTTGTGWSPIGNLSSPFKGIFDGDNCTISNLYINSTAGAANIGFGLFGTCSAAYIHDLHLLNVDLRLNAPDGYIAGICGYFEGYSRLNRSSVTGNILSRYNAGSLIGRGWYAIIKDCYSIANVTTNSSVAAWSGGLAAQVRYSAASIKNSYYSGTMTCAHADGRYGIALFRDTSLGTNTFYNNLTAYSDLTCTGKNTSTLKLVATFTETDTPGLTNPWDFVDDPNDDVGTNDFWNISAAKNNGYPFLTGQRNFADEGNDNPSNSNPYPANTATGVLVSLLWLNITVADGDGDHMNVTFGTNASGTWKIAQVNSSVADGTYRCINTTWLTQYSTRYYWRVNTSDGHGGWANNTYSFTTEAAPPGWTNRPPTSILEFPTNESTGVSIDVGNWEIIIGDLDGNNTSGTIECENGDTTWWINVENGSKSLTINTLDYDTNYTVWVNYTDGHDFVNETFWFVTGSETPYYSITGSITLNVTRVDGTSSVNISGSITNTGYELEDFFINMSWWNLSVDSLNMTLVSTNVSGGSWNNDSGYVIIPVGVLSVDEVFLFYYNVIVQSASESGERETFAARYTSNHLNGSFTSTTFYFGVIDLAEEVVPFLYVLILVSLVAGIFELIRRGLRF